MISIKYQILLSSSLVGFIVLMVGIQTWRVSKAQNDMTTSYETQVQNNCQELQAIHMKLSSIHQRFSNDSNHGANLLESISAVEHHIDNLQFENGDEIKYSLQTICTKYKNLSKQYGKGIDETSFKAINTINAMGETALKKAMAANFAWLEAEGAKRQVNNTKLRKWILLGSIVVFLLAVICGQVIARILDASLRGLRSAAKAYQSGDYSKKININVRNEFGELSKLFNKLSTEAEQAHIIEHQNQELDNLNHQLKLKNDSLDSFVYRVSHDLKAPLINIKSLLKVVNGKLANHGDSAVMKTLGFMDKNTEKLQQTIYDLLEVSRIEMNLDQKKEWVSILPIVDEIKEENLDDIKSSETIINLDLTDTDVVLFSKPNLKSILANLITNGIKYRKQEGQNEISISTHVIGQSTQLIYEDNGIGIDMEKHGDKLYGIFNRFHNHVEGSGVGLYIVKKLIEESGGKINIQSQVGLGTKFIINFPEADKVKVEG